MTPIKLDDFLRATHTTEDQKAVVHLSDIGLFHAAPRENGEPILALRFDPETGSLMPAA